MAEKVNISQKDLMEAFPSGLNETAKNMLKEGGFTHIGGKPLDGVYKAYQDQLNNTSSRAKPGEKVDISKEDLIAAFPNGFDATARKMLKDGGFTSIGGKPIDNVYDTYQRLKNSPTRGFNMDSFRGIPNPPPDGRQDIPDSPGVAERARYARLLKSNAAGNARAYERETRNKNLRNGETDATPTPLWGFPRVTSAISGSTPQTQAPITDDQMITNPKDGIMYNLEKGARAVGRNLSDVYADAVGNSPPPTMESVQKQYEREQAKELLTDPNAVSTGGKYYAAAPPAIPGSQPAAGAAQYTPQMDSFRGIPDSPAYAPPPPPAAATSTASPAAQATQYAAPVALGSPSSADYIAPGSYGARDAANPAGTAPPPAWFQQQQNAAPPLTFMQQFRNSQPRERISDRKMFRGGV